MTLNEAALEKARRVYRSTIKRGHSVTILQFRESQDAALREAIEVYLAAVPTTSTRENEG